MSPRGRSTESGRDKRESRLGLLVLLWLLVFIVGGTCAGALCFGVAQ